MRRSTTSSSTSANPHRIEIETESVIASYIHEISERHPPTELEPEGPPPTPSSD